MIVDVYLDLGECEAYSEKELWEMWQEDLKTHADEYWETYGNFRNFRDNNFKKTFIDA